MSTRRDIRLNITLDDGAKESVFYSLLKSYTFYLDYDLENDQFSLPCDEALEILSSNIPELRKYHSSSSAEGSLEKFNADYTVYKIHYTEGKLSEWSEGLFWTEVSSSDMILNLSLYVRRNNDVTVSSHDEENEDEMISNVFAERLPHREYCDNCHIPNKSSFDCIIGPRYKCLQCADLDLCWKCQHNNHKEHIMIRFTTFQFWHTFWLRPAIPYINEMVNFLCEKTGINNTSVELMSCDMCENVIGGFLYKCLQCLSFNLCQECEITRKHSQHIVMRIPLPYKWCDPNGELQHVMVSINKYLNKLCDNERIPQLPQLLFTTLFKEFGNSQESDEMLSMGSIKVSEFAAIHTLFTVLVPAMFLRMENTLKFLLILENSESTNGEVSQWNNTSTAVYRFQINKSCNKIMAKIRQKINICVSTQQLNSKLDDGYNLFLLKEDFSSFTTLSDAKIISFMEQNKRNDSVMVIVARKFVGPSRELSEGHRENENYLIKYLINLKAEETPIATILNQKETEEELMEMTGSEEGDEGDHNHIHGSVSIEENEISEICFECGVRRGLFNNIDDENNDEQLKIMENGLLITFQEQQYFVFDNRNISISDQLTIGDLEDSLLHFGCKFNIEWLVKTILQQNRISVDVRNKELSTPLMFACENDENLEIAKLLLQNGASVNALDDGKTSALHSAVFSKSLEMTNLILENGGDEHLKSTWRSVVHMAAESSSPEVLQRLIEVGKFDIEYTDRYGKTLLASAITQGKLENCKLLLSLGANIFSPDDHQLSPLHDVFEMDHPEVREYILTIAAQQKDITLKELLQWMLQPPFSDVPDEHGRTWIFKAFDYMYDYSEETSEALIALSNDYEDIPFVTIGPFGMTLDYIIYEAVKDKSFYEDNKESFNKLFENIRRASCRVLMPGSSTDVNASLDEIVDRIAEALKNVWDTWTFWKLIEEISSPLTIDWLRPVSVISYHLENPRSSVYLSKQVKLTMKPHDSYKHTVEKTTVDEQTLLHVAASSGNGIATHLLLMLGSNNVKDKNGKLPQQLALKNGHEDLAQFIEGFFKVENEKIELTRSEKSYLQNGFFISVAGEIEFDDVRIFSEIPEVSTILTQLKKLKITQDSNKKHQIKNKQKEENSQLHQSQEIQMSKNERNLLRMREEHKLCDLLDETVEVRFPVTKRVYTDGSVAPKQEYSGAAYYDYDTDTGAGYPIYPATDIHNAELVAVKIALEEVACEKDSVILTDRQPMLKVLQSIARNFYTGRGETNSILLNCIILFRLKFPPNPYISYGLHWIPAHEGLDGNDVADELAKKSMKEMRMVLCKDVEDDIRKKREKKRKLEEMLAHGGHSGK